MIYAPRREHTVSEEKIKVAIIGGTGYGGAELIRNLIAHPHVSLVRVTSIDHVDEPLESVHLNLTSTGLTFENIPPLEAAKGVDVVFLALPHKVSATMARELDDVDAKIIDLSGDFRLRDSEAYERFYRLEHPSPHMLDGRWVYGLPELFASQLKEATRVASPGCFATTIVLGLLPLAKAGLLNGSVHTVACTGSSGSGAYAKQGTHHPLRAGNLKSYKVLDHQHTPEIEQTLRDAGAAEDTRVQFVPVSAPLTRGILANSFVEVPESLSADELVAMYEQYYEGSAFVRVLGQRGAEVVAVKGSMWVDLSIELGEAHGGVRTCVISTALDNLVKGGAGQAVQSMNLMFGRPQGEGIDAPAIWP